MPRSFLVKSVKADNCKTSYQKLRDLYAETAALSLRAVAPYTPADDADKRGKCTMTSR